MSKIPCHVPNSTAPKVIFERRSTRVSFVFHGGVIGSVEDLHRAIDCVNSITLDVTCKRRERITRYVP